VLPWGTHLQPDPARTLRDLLALKGGGNHSELHARIEREADLIEMILLRPISFSKMSDV
jgi:hypothetical protein